MLKNLFRTSKHERLIQVKVVPSLQETPAPFSSSERIIQPLANMVEAQRLRWKDDAPPQIVDMAQDSLSLAQEYNLFASIFLEDWANLALELEEIAIKKEMEKRRDTLATIKASEQLDQDIDDAIFSLETRVDLLIDLLDAAQQEDVILESRLRDQIRHRTIDTFSRSAKILAARAVILFDDAVSFWLSSQYDNFLNVIYNATYLSNTAVNWETAFQFALENELSEYKKGLNGDGRRENQASEFARKGGKAKSKALDPYRKMAIEGALAGNFTSRRSAAHEMSRRINEYCEKNGIPFPLKPLQAPTTVCGWLKDAGLTFPIKKG